MILGFVFKNLLIKISLKKKKNQSNIKLKQKSRKNREIKESYLGESGEDLFLYLRINMILFLFSSFSGL